MADRYWVAGSANWDLTSSWSATSGGASGASVPTSADNVFFDRVATYTVTTTASGNTYCNNFTVSAGVVTFSLGGAASLNISGNFSVIAGTINANTSGAWRFVGSGTQTITSNGFTFISYVAFQGTGTCQLQDNFLMNPPSVNRNVDLGNGTLDLNNKTLSCIVFSSSNTNTRSIAFGTSGKISLRGARGTSFTTIFDTSTSTNLSTSGTALIEVVNSNSTSANQGLAPGTLGESQAFSLNVTAGTGTSIFIFPTGGSGNTWKNVNFTGYAGQFGNHIYAGSVVYGDWTFSTGMTVDNSGISTVITFAKTSGTQTITSNGKSFNCPLVFGAAGGTVFLADALSVSSSNEVRPLTLVNGTFDGNSKTITKVGSGVFSSTGTVTIKNISTALGFTMTSGALTQGAANTFGSVTLNNGTFDGAGFATTGAFTMATGTVSLQNITNSSTFTHTSGSLTLSGTNSIASLTYAHNGGTLTLGSNNSISTYTTTNGTLDLAGYTLTVSSYVTAAGTKNLTFNGGILAVTGATSTAFNNAVPTGFTTTAGTGTGKISMTAATAKTFVGGGSTYNCTISNDGAGALTISGSNAFLDIANTVSPVTITFTGGTTQTVSSSFSVAGTSGNLVTLNSTPVGTRATIVRSYAATTKTLFSSYLSITDISFNPSPTGSAPWVWYFDSTNVNGGNNLGAVFANNTNTTIYQITQTGSGTWTVPSDFNLTDNNVYLWGGGGGGAGGGGGTTTRRGGGGGGGGGFALVPNFATTVGSSIILSVGAAGTAGAVNGNGGAGGSTTWNSGAYTAGGGGAGLTGSTSVQGLGGAGGIGSTYNGAAGGRGGASVSAGTQISAGGGGGGGAGGPSGAGGAGGNGSSAALIVSGGGGGGGNGGGSAGGNGTSSNTVYTVGNGGNNASGTGGGVGIGAAGSSGGGGAGSGGRSSTGIEILGVVGGGSGGGGSTNNFAPGSAAGAVYGGGGSGGGATTGGTLNASVGSAGGQGAIFIVYSPLANSGAFFAMF